MIAPSYSNVANVLWWKFWIPGNKKPSPFLTDGFNWPWRAVVTRGRSGLGFGSGLPFRLYRRNILSIAVLWQRNICAMRPFAWPARNIPSAPSLCHCVNTGILLRICWLWINTKTTRKNVNNKFGGFMVHGVQVHAREPRVWDAPTAFNHAPFYVLRKI